MTNRVKPIDRDIQGVIIVGQGEETNVAQELEEYVVTKELQKHFADFFAAYKKGILGTTPKMGVWISGFFGSGKSHFLKILSYLLENRKVGDRTALDYFTEDKKITDPMVLADIRLAAETPSDVVLFNIDSKSDTAILIPRAIPAASRTRTPSSTFSFACSMRCRDTAAPCRTWRIWSSSSLKPDG